MENDLLASRVGVVTSVDQESGFLRAGGVVAVNANDHLTHSLTLEEIEFGQSRNLVAPLGIRNLDGYASYWF
jgi:hypothetical protein